MDARQHLFETRQTLKEVFETQAGWRAGKAAEYPDDKRNQKAAEIFRRLHDTLDDVPQDVIDAYQGVWDRLDSGKTHEAIVVEQDRLREIGFHTEPQNAEEFLRELIEGLKVETQRGTAEETASDLYERAKEAAHEEADEAAKEEADEIAKEAAEEAAKEAYDEAYKEAYDEAYDEAYKEAYAKAYEEALGE